MAQQQSKKKKDKDKSIEQCAFPRQNSATAGDSQQEQGLFSSFFKSLSRSMPPVFGSSYKNKDTSILKDKSKSTCEGIYIGGGHNNNSNSSDKDTEQQEMLFEFIKPKERPKYLEVQMPQQQKQQKNTPQQQPDKSPNNMDQILLSRNDVSSNGMLTVEEDNHEGSNDTAIERNRLNDINRLQCVTPHEQSVLNIETMSSEEWDTQNDQDDDDDDDNDEKGANEVRKIIDKTLEYSSTSNLKVDLRLNKPCVFVTKCGQTKQIVQVMNGKKNMDEKNVHGSNPQEKEIKVKLAEFTQNYDDKNNNLEKQSANGVSSHSTARKDSLNSNQAGNVQDNRMKDDTSEIVSVSSFIVQNSREVQESSQLKSQLQQQAFNIKVSVVSQHDKAGNAQVIVGTDCEKADLPEISCMLYRSACPKEKQRIFRDVIQGNGKLILKDDFNQNTARELLRYKGLEDCSNLLLDAILQKYSMMRHAQLFLTTQSLESSQNIYEIEENSLQLFQKNDNANLFILKIIDDANDKDNINKTGVSFKGISEYLSSGSFQNSASSQEIVVSLLSATIAAYQIFVSAGITLPALSSTSIAVSLPEKRVYFTQLEQCTKIVGFTTTSNAISEKLLRKKERQQLIIAIKGIAIALQAPNSSSTQSVADSKVAEKIMEDFIEKGEVEEITLELHGTVSKSVLDLSKRAIEFKENTRFSFLNANCSSSFEERSNFGKCRRLQTLSAVYSSLLNPDEEMKCLEQLRVLQSSSYGEDSAECLKTIVQLCRAYSRRNQSSNGNQCQTNYIPKLVSLLEPATAYLRQQLPSNPASASDLYSMLRQKIRLTNSPTTLLDFNALIEDIQKQNKFINRNVQGELKTQQQQIVSSSALSLNVPKLYYTFGCYLYDSQDIQASVQQFINVIAAVSGVQKSISVPSTQLKSQVITSTPPVTLTTTQLKLSFYAQSHLARSLFRLGRKSESAAILKQLSELQLKFACPVYFQFSGIFHYEMNQFLKAHTLLHQAYVLIQSKPPRKCHNNIDFLDLLLYYCLATMKTKGAQNPDFQRLVREMKNLTGDYHNVDCLLEISNVLCDNNLKDLALEKLQQAKGILKLLGITSKQETQEFKLYKKKETAMQEKINKIGFLR